MGFRTIPRRWRIVLLASLAVNLLVVGLVAGALLDRDDRRPGFRGQPLVSALPDADRAALRDELGRPDREDRRARFRALLDAIRAEPFDAAALRDLLATERARGQDRAARFETAIIARLSGMDAAARADYARRLEQMIRRGPGRRD